MNPEHKYGESVPGNNDQRLESMDAQNCNGSCFFKHNLQLCRGDVFPKKVNVFVALMLCSFQCSPPSQQQVAQIL